MNLIHPHRRADIPGNVEIKLVRLDLLHPHPPKIPILRLPKLIGFHDLGDVLFRELVLAFAFHEPNSASPTRPPSPHHVQPRIDKHFAGTNRSSPKRILTAPASRSFCYPHCNLDHSSLGKWRDNAKVCLIGPKSMSGKVAREAVIRSVGGRRPTFVGARATSGGLRCWNERTLRVETSGRHELSRQSSSDRSRG